MAEKKSKFSRRDFIKFAGATVIGAGMSGGLYGILRAGDTAIIPVSHGYLLVDMKKCATCYSCMLACSLVHEGKENLSLARIQVMQNPFEPFPGDITMSQCRQCVEPACVPACPTGALHAEPSFGNVRMVDQSKCIGCQACVGACPFTPSRAIWNFQMQKSQKCDLCANSAYWGEKGGPEGKQACVEICPMEAIKFSKEIPVQEGDAGYQVNLRGENWKKLYPIE